MDRTMSVAELKTQLERHKDAERVVFDFGTMAPTDFRSWRGIYSELALGYANWAEWDSPDPPSASDLLDRLNKACSETHYGYKGGEFRTYPGTQVWVDNWGEYTSTILAGVYRQSESTLMLLTRHEDAPLPGEEED